MTPVPASLGNSTPHSLFPTSVETHRVDCNKIMRPTLRHPRSRRARIRSCLPARPAGCPEPAGGEPGEGTRARGEGQPLTRVGRGGERAQRPRDPRPGPAPPPSLIAAPQFWTHITAADLHYPPLHHMMIRGNRPLGKRQIAGVRAKVRLSGSE